MTYNDKQVKIYQKALEKIAGRLKGIEDEDLTRAERQIKEIVKEVLGDGEKV